MIDDRVIDLQQEPARAATGLSTTRRATYLRVAAATVGVCAWLYYLVALEWNPLEVLQMIAGTLALWLPIGSLCYLLLGEQVASRAVRLILSAAASYSLTTLFYFAFSVLQVQPLFYVAQAIIAGIVAIHAFRHGRLKGLSWSKINLLAFDWLLFALVALSLVACIHYQLTYTVNTQTGDRALVAVGDQTYFTSQAYELARSIPPAQQVNQAGLPERAYHMFPHLTTMLLSRYTGQGDMLRAHMAYHYAAMEILLVLLVYALVRTLTSSRGAGYLGASLVFVLALATPGLVPRPGIYFFFTLYPYVTSGEDPVLSASPQMLSGLLVCFGVLLAVALISRRLRDNLGSTSLLIVTALMVATLLRFRIQIALVLLPGFLLLLGYGWWRVRHKAYLIAGALAVAVTALLYLEMRLPVYLKNTADLYIGYTGLTSRENGFAFYTTWPFSGDLYNALAGLIKDKGIFDWTWQAVSMAAFVVLSMLGIPFMLALLAYLRQGTSWREWKLYSLMTLWLLVGSLLGGILLTTTYDRYSVGGQMLLHTIWYAFPLLPVALWQLYRFLQARLSWPQWRWVAIWIAAMSTALAVQMFSPPTPLMVSVRDRAAVISANELLALAYIHDRTPQDAVIIHDKRMEPRYSHDAIYGGIGGRRTYRELTGSSIKDLSARSGPQEDRMQRINDIWRSTDQSKFCELLTSTPATYLVEFGDNPLSVKQGSCIGKVWESPGQENKVIVWQIARSTPASGSGN